MLGFKSFLSKAIHATNSKIEVLFSHPEDTTVHSEYPYELSLTPPRAQSPEEYQQYYPLSRISAPDDLFEDEKSLTVCNPDVFDSDEPSSSHSSIRTVYKVTSRDSISWESFEVQAVEEEAEQLKSKSTLLCEEPQALFDPDTFAVSFSDEEDGKEGIEQECRSPLEYPTSCPDSYLCLDDVGYTAGEIDGADCHGCAQNLSNPPHSPLDEDRPLFPTTGGEERPSCEYRTVTAEDFHEDGDSQPTMIVSDRYSDSSSTSEEWEDICPQDTPMSSNGEDHDARFLLKPEQCPTSTRVPLSLSPTQHTIAQIRSRNSLASSNPPFATRMGRSTPYHLRYQSMGPRSVSLANKRSATFSQLRWRHSTAAPSLPKTIMVRDEACHSNRHRQRQRFVSRDWTLWFSKLNKVKSLTKTLYDAAEDTVSVPPITPAIIAMDRRSSGHRHCRHALDENWALWDEKLAKVACYTANLQEAAEDLRTFDVEVQ